MPDYLPLPAVAADTGVMPRTLRLWVSNGTVSSIPPEPGQRSRRVDAQEVRRVAHARGMATTGTVITALPFTTDEDEVSRHRNGTVSTGIPVLAAERLATLEATLERVGDTYVELSARVDRLDLAAAKLTDVPTEIRQLRWMMAGLAALLIVTLLANVVLLVTVTR